MNRRLTHLLLLVLSLFMGTALQAREYSALVVEPESGRILYERYADELRHPASVTKMMTLYLVFEALERGEITLNTPCTISRNAVLRPPSRLGLTPGDTLAVEDAILGLVTRSANDAATVIAENLGGTEAEFAALMTSKARQLGMRDSVFRNASGLPDPQQVTTARDMYKLGRALINDFPRYYPYFSTPRFYYRGQSFDNHNHLMETYPGMDGIKTGFINSSGFNLVASAKRNGHRLIGVVFGGPSAVRRDSHMRDILNDGFAQLDGAAPGYVEASFDAKPEVSRSRLTRYESEPPQLTFGNPKRFKASRAHGPRSATPAGNPASGKARQAAAEKKTVRQGPAKSATKPAPAAASPCKGAKGATGHCAGKAKAKSRG